MNLAKSFLRGKWVDGDAYKYNDRAPGVQPHSLECKDFPTLTQRFPSSDDIMMYVVGEKTDGERRILTSFEDSVILFDRKYAPTVIEYTHTINNCILDGELVGDDVFIVHDAICIDNKNIQDTDLCYRLEAAQLFVNEWKGNLKITVKRFITPRYLHQGVPEMGTKVDGLIFAPVSPNLPTFKWKPGLSNTIDFMFIDGGMYLYDSNFAEPLVWHHDTSEKWPENSIIECAWDEKSSTWYGLKQRNDKNNPNSRYVYYCTLKNIKEDIQKQDLIQLLS